MKATATAPSNIALVKYWGKRDEKLVLPQNGSISMCLSGLHTTTTVEFDEQLKSDVVTYDGSDLQGSRFDRVVRHLDLVRALAQIETKARVASTANFPMSAGLASSASGFAALSLAASEAAGLALDEKALSILARQGSGSASRSIPDGFVEWDRGELADGTDSFAHSIHHSEVDWGFRMIIPVISQAEKKITSRAGMAQSVLTSPYYAGWLATVEHDLRSVRLGIEMHDFELIGSTAEANALKMHALMFTTVPSIIYWLPQTLDMIAFVHQLRDQGTQVWFTIDGGPQVKIMCMEESVLTITDALKSLACVQDTIVCQPCHGAHLFTTRRHP
ncbi:diphosphomevalonate decarboxylase [Candidatus Wirthbacteria bacterium CG2_30_54_11]|uniref:diphosphomevalonate decarboxylase n=1 Tax=Candidatus Wirthbacteria bacterium CG2_30_54_11 TaxID=1817892 RepID=A0A1J5IKX4_9BACT|nr:MAG: diphosphomevalonate decarboxylase [Candidatus Wirthbacteria bacterium CG2_30_54_11]